MTSTVFKELHLLARSTLRKVAADTGFDLLVNEPRWIAAASSHAPLRAVLARAGDGYWAGLSMRDVAQALGLPLQPAPPDAPPGLHWLACDGLPALDALLGRAWTLSRVLPDALEQRFEAVLEGMPSTEREAVVRRRIGQELFRQSLMSLWNGRCALTGLAVPELLRASHAKPWVDSSNAERLDVYNGLLLSANLDAAFDTGLMTLDAQGGVLWSPRLDAATVRALGVPAGARAALDEQHGPYLEWHRAKVFQGKAGA